MKATTVICIVLGVWICGAYCSMQEDNVVEFAPEEHTSVSIGHRTKRSPLDPIVAPLLIGKSFLYGALLGPKLFKPPYYGHRPYYGHHYHYPVHHGYGGYGGYGHGGHYGGYGNGYGYGHGVAYGYGR